MTSDPAVLGELLALHHAPGGQVADLSWGLGKLWSRELLEHYQPITVDLDPAKGATIVGDWSRQDAYFTPGAIATEIWDPPHIGDAGATGLVGGRIGGWGERYGTRAPELKGPTAVIDLFVPFLESAWPSLEPGRGTLIVKIADQVRQKVLRFQPYWLWLLAQGRGWHACDRYERQRAQPPHNTTHVQEHIRRATTHWLVFHNFEGCPGGGVVVRRRCAGCARVVPVRRQDQRTCGAANCRQRLSRQERRRSGLALPTRSVEQRQAGYKVNADVRAGHRPPANALPCTDCGHVWAPGERDHEYDHHLGYALEHHRDVEPVCTRCHARRTQSRLRRRTEVEA